MFKKYTEKNYKIFFKFLSSYIIIVILGIVLSSFFYYKNIIVLKDEVIKNNSILLQQTQQIINQRLSEVEETTQLLSTDSNVIKFQTIKDPYYQKNIYQVLSLVNNLPKYDLTNTFIIDYFILYGNKNIVVNPNIVYKLDEFYKYYFNYTNINYEQWKKEIFGEYFNNKYLPYNNCILKEKEYSIISYVKPLENFHYLKTCILILIDNKQIKNMLKKMCFTNKSWACIVDDYGNIISYTGENFNTDLINSLLKKHIKNNKGHLIYSKDLITYTTSEYNNWKYIIGQPYKSVIKKVSDINKMAIISLFIFLLIGIFISYKMASTNTQPLSAIIKSIETNINKYKNDNIYQVIQNTLNQLSEDNELLKTKIDYQVHLIKDSFFRRLLKGEIKTTYELQRLMDYTNIEIHGDSYGVIIIHLYGYHQKLDDYILKDLDMKRLIIQEIFKSVPYENLYLHIASQDTIALLVCGNFENELHWKSTVINIIKYFDHELLSQNDILLTFAIGNYYHQLLDVSLSYKEAKNLLNYIQWDKEHAILWYNNHFDNMNTYYFPNKIKSRLLTVIRKGSNEEAETILDNLYHKNFIEKKLPIHFIYMFLIELSSTALKVINEIPIKDNNINDKLSSLIEHIMLSLDGNQNIFTHLKNIIFELCDLINKNKKSHNIALIEDILQFIEENYTNPQISLSTISNRFGLSEVYMSQFFKEQCGQNFSNTLELKRMEQAVHLLEKTNWTIKKISKTIGYNSLNSFSRAFKRIYDMSASEYRQKSKVC